VNALAARLYDDPEQLHHRIQELEAELALLRAQADHEARLRESEERFRALTDAAPVLMWETDAAGRAVWFNRTWLALTGRSLEEESGEGWIESVHPDDRDHILSVVNDAHAHRVPFRTDYRLRRSDGAWRTIDDAGMPRHAADGTFLGFVGSAVDVTEARETLAALALSEERLRLAAETTELGTWDLDLRTQKLTSSLRGKILFGLPVDGPFELKDFFAAVHPGDRERVANAIARATDPAIRAPFDVEFRVIGREDGAERWLAVKGRALFDAQGHGVRAIGTALDITARQRAEAALRESEAVLRMATEATGLGTWSYVFAPGRSERGTLTCSPRCRAIFSLRPDEPPAIEAFWSRIHPNDLPEMRRRFACAVDPAAGGQYEAEFRIRLPLEGAERWVLLSGQTFFDTQGRPTRAVGTALDITARKQQEEALRRAAAELEQRVAERTTQLAESEARFRAYFESAEDMLFTVKVTEDGDFLYEGFNPQGERRSGFSNANAAGRPPEAFMPPAMARIVRRQLVLARDGGLRRFHSSFTDLPGGPGVFDSLLVPVRDADGRVVRLIGSVREVTEQVRLEEELRQTQKMQAIGQLTGGVAHDFNNLLTGIIGSLELLEREISSERGRRLLAAAQRSADRGAQLTSQLLAFSRRQQLQPRPLDLNALVLGMVGILRSTLGGSVEVKTALAPALWPAMADAMQLELAILNIAINARDAMQSGGTILIETANVETGPPQTADDPPAGAFICIAISDTGTGMPPEVLARAFEPFFTTKGVGRGSGLGLSQVLGLAKQLGGGVRLESRLGTGTTVRIYLPRAVPAATEGDQPAAPNAAARVPPGCTVLLVEDDSEAREVATAVLESLGCIVLPVDGGGAALEMLATTPRIDAAVVDYAMPGMNGPETVARLRAARPSLPVVFATGYADVTALQTLQTPVVRKPFQSSELAAVLGRVLDQRAPAARKAAQPGWETPAPNGAVASADQVG
jgi:PAS domain S-box-containing protein